MKKLEKFKVVKKIEEDLKNAPDWVAREIEYICNGDHISEDKVYRYLLKTLDTSKKNYGKRGANVMAVVGQQFISDVYGVALRDTASIWKELPPQLQKVFDRIIRKVLKKYKEILQEV